MNITIKKLNPTDLDKFTQLIRVFEAVFEMENFNIPAEKYLQQLLTKADFFVFVAVLNNRVVGGLTAYILQQYYAVSPLLYIYDLAVETTLQRKGIGKLLISNLNSYYKEMGFEEVFVQAKKLDDEAIQFYRSTGASGTF